MRLRFAAAVVAVSVAAISTAPAANAQFALGLDDPGLESSSPTFDYQALRAIDGSTVRLQVRWAAVAPTGTSMPSGFNASDPSDPQYSWTTLDAAVRTAAAHGSRILLTLFDAPAWAEGPSQPNSPVIDPGAWDPDPAEFGQFAHAVALRYSGTYPDPLNPGSELPQVSEYEIWNEENLPFYLAAPDLVSEYRQLLNAGYSAIKGVNPSNVVSTGGLAPVSFLPPYSVSPLLFAAELMCLVRSGTTFQSAPSCPVHAHFDAFAHHPYSLAATPTKHAYQYDDVLMGDLGKLDALLRAAERLGTISRGPHPLWITEWSWPTNPPNRTVGDPAATAARFVAYSMYEMWRAGAQLTVWQVVREEPNPTFAGGGLYTAAGKPKLTLSAYAFPMIASVSGSNGYAWGRFPGSGPVSITVQRLVGGGWQTVAHTTTHVDGIFQAHFPASGNATYRARVPGGPTSLQYNSTPIPPVRTHLKTYSG